MTDVNMQWKYVEREALIGERAHVPELLDLNRGCRLSSQWIRTSLLLVPTCPGGPPIRKPLVYLKYLYHPPLYFSWKCELTFIHNQFEIILIKNSHSLKFLLSCKLMSFLSFIPKCIVLNSAIQCRSLA